MRAALASRRRAAAALRAGARPRRRPRRPRRDRHARGAEAGRLERAARSVAGRRRGRPRRGARRGARRVTGGRSPARGARRRRGAKHDGPGPRRASRSSSPSPTACVPPGAASASRSRTSSRRRSTRPPWRRSKPSRSTRFARSGCATGSPTRSSSSAQDGRVVVIEVAARIPGGQMGDLVRIGVGVDLVEVAVRQALGEEVRDELALPRLAAAARDPLPDGGSGALAHRERGQRRLAASPCSQPRASSRRRRTFSRVTRSVPSRSTAIAAAT